MNAKPNDESQSRFVTTHFLSATHVPREGPRLDRADIKFRARLSSDEYRRLYLEVGGPWLWFERSELCAERIEELIGRDEVELLLLSQKKVRAGYCRLITLPDDEIKIQYFGLTPRFIGKGLGLAFLRSCLHHAFERGAKRVTVHTCSFDYPERCPPIKGPVSSMNVESLDGCGFRCRPSNEHVSRRNRPLEQ